MYLDFIKFIKLRIKTNTLCISSPKSMKKYKQYENFKGKINSEYDNNVKALYWEDIVDKDSELYKKYFAE